MEEDNDTLQQRLLSKLNEYGDSLLDEDDYNRRRAQTKKAKLKNKLQSVDDRPDKTPKLPPATTAKTKKTKKKATVTSSDNASLARNKGNEKFVDFDEELRQFKDELLEKERREKEAELRNERGNGKPPVIVFQDPSRRKKKRKIADQAGAETSRDEFSLKRARQEVRQFGLKGFSYKEWEKREKERAISLGAWAPKRQRMNCKDYMVKQKRKTERDRQQRDMERKMGYKAAKRPTTEKTRVKNQGFWRDPTQDKKFFLDGQVGRYKHGVQVVSKDDIARAKSRSRRGNRAARTQKV